MNIRLGRMLWILSWEETNHKGKEWYSYNAVAAIVISATISFILSNPSYERISRSHSPFKNSRGGEYNPHGGELGTVV